MRLKHHLGRNSKTNAAESDSQIMPVFVGACSYSETRPCSSTSTYRIEKWSPPIGWPLNVAINKCAQWPVQRPYPPTRSQRPFRRVR
eukprot:5317834-Pleurochrysis_carterae.AAC.1